jgi:hypothetical protein
LIYVYIVTEYVYMTRIEAGEPEDAWRQEEHFTEPVAATVTIRGAGVAITREVDDATMSSIIALLFGGRESARTGAQRAQNYLNPEGRPLWDASLTLGEFLDEAGARTFSQKICAAGYYREKFEGQDSFDRDYIKAALVAAHESMPANLSRDLVSAASGKLIAAKPGEAGHYFVTTTGRKAVESQFQELPRRKPPKRRKLAAISSNGGPE